MEPTSWRTLRKTPSNIYIEYAGTFTSNLNAKDFCLLPSEQCELSIDLSANLTGRPADTNERIDARDLADGAAADITLVQIFDKQVLDRMRDTLRSMELKPKTWVLRIILDKTWRYQVRPEVKEGGSRSLFLYVIERLSDATTDGKSVDSG
jgi:hypothetical protein